VASGYSHLNVVPSALLTLSSSYKISGGANAHFLANENAVIGINASITVTLTGTPAFAGSFALANNLSQITVPTITFSGSATGQRYFASSNSLIQTNGAGANYFPGSTSGATASGGQYL
ncbi:hypothetical protein ACYOEI_37055, partial [Singulisphaera rosea]